MIYLKLFLLTIPIVYIIDLSGFIDSVKRFYHEFIIYIKVACLSAGKEIWIINLLFDRLPNNWRDVRIKPFDCSLCMTFWLLTGLSFFNGELTEYTFCFITMLSYMSNIITQALETIKDFFGVCIDRIYDKIVPVKKRDSN